MYQLTKFKTKCVNLIALILLILISDVPVTYTQQQQRAKKLTTPQRVRFLSSDFTNYICRISLLKLRVFLASQV